MNAVLPEAMRTQSAKLDKALGLLGVLVIVAIHLMLSIPLVAKLPAVPSYDAHNYIQRSRFFQESGEIAFETPNTFVPVLVNYPTSHTSLFSLLSSYSGVEVETVYRFAAPVMFSLFLLCFYLLVRQVIGSTFAALLGVMLLGMGTYNLYRSTMPLPETFALMLQVLVVLVLAWRSLSFRRKMAVVLFLLIAIAYVHPRSLAIPVFLLAVYVLIALFKSYGEERRFPLGRILFLVGIASAFVVLVIPVIAPLFEQYAYYLSGGQDWLATAVNPPTYVLPSWEEYVDKFGMLNLVLGLTGFFALLSGRRRTTLNTLICLWLLLTVALTQSLRFGLYAPPYRFYSYFSIPLALAAAVGVDTLRRGWSGINLRWAGALCLSLLMVATVVQYVHNNENKSVFVGLYPSDFQAAEWIESRGKSAVTVGTFAFHLGVRNSEVRPAVIHDIVLSSSPDELEKKLSHYYPQDSEVYFLVTRNMDAPLRENYPQFNTLLGDYPLLFEETETGVYELR